MKSGRVPGRSQRTPNASVQVKFARIVEKTRSWKKVKPRFPCSRVLYSGFVSTSTCITKKFWMTITITIAKTTIKTREMLSLSPLPVHSLFLFSILLNKSICPTCFADSLLESFVGSFWQFIYIIYNLVRAFCYLLRPEPAKRAKRLRFHCPPA